MTLHWQLSQLEGGSVRMLLDQAYVLGGANTFMGEMGGNERIERCGEPN